MKKIALAGCSLFALTAGLFISLTVAAKAQNPAFPQTLPPNTVVGRTGIVAGPAQAIPINILTGNILLAISGDCAATISGTVTCTINDRTAIAANGASKWSPLFFGNTGTGRVSRFNRIFCGEATASSSDVGPVTTKDWLETLLTNTTGVAEFVCVDTTGQLGVLGASRASDFRTVFGTSTGGAQGVTGFGVNDDTVGAAIAVGMNAVGVRRSGALGITAGYQADMNNVGTVVDLDPSATGIPNGTTFGALVTSGAFSSIGTTNITAGLAFALGRASGPTARKGLIFTSNALDPTVGVAGDGVAADLFRNQSIRWRNATPTTDTEMWGAANGLNINSSISVGVAGSTAGGIFVNGAGGGTITLQPQFAAGTWNWNWPTSSGSSGQPLLSGGGGATPMSFGTLGVGGGGTGDTGTAWLAFTPSPSCGTATFTVNAARSKTLGKTTWISVDISFTALGTCTTGVSPAFSFTLPNNSNNNSELTGREFANNSAMVGCTLQFNSATVLNCVKQTTTLINWTGTDRMIISGVYENQ